MSFKIKISADRLKMFNNKCVSSKNNSKGFWKMLRADKSRRNPSHFTDPVDKTTLIANKGKISKCLVKHFCDVGKDNVESHRTPSKITIKTIKFRRKVCFH